MAKLLGDIHHPISIAELQVVGLLCSLGIAAQHAEQEVVMLEIPICESQPSGQPSTGVLENGGMA
eukprot:7031486-Alexandrium_andersonii.AAC.1